MNKIFLAAIAILSIAAPVSAVAQFYENIPSQAQFAGSSMSSRVPSADMSSSFAQPYDHILRGNLWNESMNANGIRNVIDTAAMALYKPLQVTGKDGKNKPLAISYAQGYGTIENGDYRPSWGSGSLWRAGAKAESIMHLKSFSMKGAFGFEHQEGKDMCASMFINPGFYPIDIIEYTPGRKTLQTYTFDGAIAVDVADNWRVGGELDFRGSNYSKRKDLRHVNYGLHILFAPSVQYYNDNWALGLTYILSKDSENVDAEQIGTTGDVLYAFIDKGNSFGMYGIWDNSGIHLDEMGVKGFPINQISNGAAVQYSRGKLFGELKWLYSNGQAGEKQFIWYKFHSNEFSLKLGYKINDNHSIRLSGTYFDQTNRESLLDKVTEGGVTTVRFLGSNQIYNRKNHSLALQYNYDSRKFDLQFKGGWLAQRSVSNVKYPFSQKNEMKTWMADANAVWHFGLVDLGAELFWGNGSYELSSWDVDQESGVQSEGDFEIMKYCSDMLYNAGSRAGGNLSLRFNFKPGLWFEISEGLVSGKAYCNWTYSADSGNQTLLPEPDNAQRWRTSLKIGYNF